MGNGSTLPRQLTAFIIVGGLSAVVDFGLLTLLMANGMAHTWAKAISWLAGTITAYLLNARYTFTAATSKRGFAAVMALYGLTFVLQVGLFAVLYPLLLPSFGNWSSLVGFVIAQGVATTINFVVQRLAIYRS